MAGDPDDIASHHKHGRALSSASIHDPYINYQQSPINRRRNSSASAHTTRGHRVLGASLLLKRPVLSTYSVNMAALEAIVYRSAKQTEGGQAELLVLDQTRLPHEHVYNPVTSVAEGWTSIREMKVSICENILFSTAHKSPSVCLCLKHRTMLGLICLQGARGTSHRYCGGPQLGR